MIRLSLIIATYNRAASLVRTLDSIAAQRHPRSEWECVVVDNNSQDDTPQRFEQFRQAHPQLALRRVVETRQGLSHARNRGIAETTGEIVAILDDDERVNDDFIGAYLRFFDAHPDVAAAGGRIIAEYPDGRPRWMSRITEAPIANPIDLGDSPCPFPAGRIPGGGNMALRRSALRRYGVFDPSLGRCGTKLIGGEESDLFERLRRAGESYWYLPDAVMWHIIPAGKLTDGYFRKLCFNIGISQSARARMRRGRLRLLLGEAAKWGIALACGAVLAIALQPGKAQRILLMRLQITRGILHG